METKQATTRRANKNSILIVVVALPRKPSTPAVFRFCSGLRSEESTAAGATWKNVLPSDNHVAHICLQRRRSQRLEGLYTLSLVGWLVRCFSHSPLKASGAREDQTEEGYRMERAIQPNPIGLWKWLNFVRSFILCKWSTCRWVAATGRGRSPEDTNRHDVCGDIGAKSGRKKLHHDLLFAREIWAEKKRF